MFKAMLPELEKLLAPGDAKSADVDWSGYEFRVIESPDDPAFEDAYAALWREFGPVAEIETPAVLALRLGWDPSSVTDGLHLLYRLVLLTCGGRFVAARDHTAILPAAEGAECVVHLSHLLVAPDFRRTGVAGAMRALPLLTAQECIRRSGREGPVAVTLAAEMEHPDPGNPVRMQRLIAYAKAGYSKPDPRVVPYLQPDFRDPADIDASGGAPRPLPFSMILRRVGREGERDMSGAELQQIASALYRMYALGFRASDMAPVWDNLARFPDDDARVALLPPDSLP
jgi:GNAT superfamily N-acetyltransferase